MRFDASSVFRLPTVLALLLAISLVLLASGAHAQELTGTIYGKVAAEDGAALPGVTVKVSSPRLIRGSELRVSNEVGQYRATALPPGVYEVTAELSGFQRMTRGNIVLTAGASLEIDFRLGLATVQENITVVGESPLLDVRNAQTTRVLEQSFIENIPVGRNFGELVITMPGVQDAEYKLFPSQSVHGGTPRDNQYNVDGAVAGDSSGGQMNVEIPYDIIEEVQVSTGGISAEFGQASAAVFNFITKSGGNELRGGANFFGYTDSTAWDNINDELRAKGLTAKASVTRHYDGGFLLGGPIKKGRVWYFGNARKVDEKIQRPDFPARHLDWDDFQNFVKLTTQVTAGLRVDSSLTIRRLIDYPSQSRTNFTINDDERAWGKDHRRQHIGNAGLTWVVNDRTVVDARFGENDTTLESIYQLGDFSPYLETTTGKVSGRPVTTLGDTFERGRRGVNANVTYFLASGWGGSHQFKTGVSTEYSTYGRGAFMPDDTSYELQNGRPSRVLLYNTPGVNRMRIYDYSAYVQDQWTAGRVTLNLGVRFQATEGLLGEQEMGGGRWFPRQTFAEVRDVLTWVDVSPRLGLTWKVNEAGVSAVKLSYGRYYNPLLTRDISNPYGAGRLLYDWNDLNGDLVFQRGEEGTLRGNSTVPSPVLTDPDLRRPHVDAVHLGYERQLGNHFALSATGIYRLETDLFEQISLTRPHSAYIPVTVTNPLNGQPLTVFTLNPAIAPIPEQTMITNPPDLERKYYGIELAATKRMSNRWQAHASATIGKSQGTNGNSFASAGVYRNPNSLINDYGALEMDSRVNMKIQGSYVAAHGIVLSAFYNGIGGRPISLQLDSSGAQFNGSQNVRFSRADNPAIIAETFITVRGDQRGSERFGFRNKLSFRAEKELRMGRWRAGLLADFMNVLNINTVTAVESLIYDQANFMKPSLIENPRTVRLGIRVDF